MENKSSYEKYFLLYEKFKKAREATVIQATSNRVNYYSDVLEKYINDISFIEPTPQVTNQFENVEKGVLSTEFYESVINHLTEYRKLNDDLSKPFKIFIIGSGNYGKSTLINSLLGGDYAVTDIIPKTWKIDVYNKTTDSHNVQLHYKDGTTQTVSKEEAIVFIDEEEQRVEDANRKIRKILRNARQEKKFDNPQAEEEYKEKINKEMGYTPLINEVHWGVPNNGILDNLILVDTPGLDQKNYSGEVINNIETFSDKSDGIIWMLDATTIDARLNDTALFNNLLNTLEKQQNAVQIDNIIAVINKIDLIAANEEEKEAVINKAHLSYKNKFKKIIPYSALMAYEANISEDETLKKSSGYYELLDLIKNQFIRNSAAIQTNRVNQSCTNYNKKILEKVEEYTTRLETDNNKAFMGIETTVSNLEREAEKLANDFSQLLQHEFNKMTPQLSKNLDVIKDFNTEEKIEYHIRQNIYQERTVKDALTTFINQAEKEAKKQVENIMRKYMVTQYKYLDTFKNLPNLPTPKLESKIETNDVYMPKVMNSMAIGGAIGMIFGGVGAAIGAGLGGLFSSWARNDQIAEVENYVIEYYNQISELYSSTLYDYFNEIINILVENILLSFA